MRCRELKTAAVLPWLAMLAGAVLVSLVTGPVGAQEIEEFEEELGQEVSVLFPGEAGVLRLNAAMPQDLRTGQEFTYLVEVENVTEDVILHDIRLQQTVTGDLQIETAQLQGTGQNAARQQQGQQQGDPAWTIDRLLPGESETIEVTAAASAEGELLVCLEVTSYRPAVCLTANVVQAELEIAKEAPERANLCEVIEWAYYVQNDGTADLNDFQIVDQLPEGIRTIDGEESLWFKVDGLEAGETRKFVADLVAVRPGEYASSAIGIGPGGERVRSARPTTTVEVAELALEMEGPSTTYVGELASYTVRVSNVGKAIAPDVQLAIGVPETVELANITDAQVSTQPVRQTATTQTGTPQRAQQAQVRQQAGGQARRVDPDVPLEYREVDLGNLEPGQTVEVRFSTRTNDGIVAPYRAAAMFVCRPGEEEREIVATAVQRTEFIALPALLVAVVDAEDPVSTGEETVYNIVVVNQGQAPDHNVQIVAELPDALEYIGTEGPTEAQVEGNRITFEPIERLDPDEEARWQVRARAKDAGEVVFKTTLTSQGLQRSAQSEEPTQLVRCRAEWLPPGSCISARRVAVLGCLDASHVCF